MRRIGWSAAAAIAVLALAACQKKTGSAAANGTAAPSGAAARPAAPVSAVRPSRKAGLWETTTSSDQVTQTSRLCVDAAIDEKLGFAGQRPGASPCRENKITPRLGGGWDVASVCDLGEMGKVTTTGTATGDFGSHYRVELTSTTEGSAAPQMNGERRMIVESTWRGPCPADMKPGDIEVAGMKMNLLDAQARAAGRPGGR